MQEPHGRAAWLGGLFGIALLVSCEAWPVWQLVRFRRLTR